MAWITQAYLRNSVGVSTVTALGLDDAAVFAQFEGECRAAVASAMQYAGYEVPITLEPDAIASLFLQSVVAPLVLRNALQLRKGIKLPPSADASISEAEWRLDAIYKKRLPIPGMQPNANNAYGGSTASPVTGPSARVSVFGAGKLNGF